MNEGKKFDQGKPRYDLVPFRALDEITQVLGHGARKYGEDNWRLVADGRRRYIAAALRHISAYQQGQQSDPDSTLHHLAHAACSLIFILAMELEAGTEQPMSLEGWAQLAEHMGAEGYGALAIAAAIRAKGR